MAPLRPSKMDRLVRLGVVYDGMPVYLKHKLPSYVEYDPDDPRFRGVLRIEGSGSALVERADGSTHFVSGAAVDVFNAFKPGEPRQTAAGNEHWGTDETSFARWSERLEPVDPLAWLARFTEQGPAAGPAPPVVAGGRNPPWTREESRRVLDAMEDALKGGAHLDLDTMERLSDELRENPAVEPVDAATFRRPDAIMMRVVAYISIKNGLHDCPGGCLEEQLWEERGLPRGPFPQRDHSQSPPKRRNPSWTRDEVVLALDLYRRIRFNATSSNHPEVVALSGWLRQARLATPVDEETFRSPSAVYQKLANFGSLDPDHPSAGLPNSSDLDRTVWKEFHDDRERLVRVADTIRTMVNSFGPPEYTEGPEEAFEGRVLRAVHLRRERNPRLRKEAIRRHREEHGNLSCEACGFDFEAVYGERGADTIQVHHMKPVADLRPDEATHVRDLALLCANCHFIVHRRRPMLSVQDVRDLVRTNGAAGGARVDGQTPRRPVP